MTGPTRRNLAPAIAAVNLAAVIFGSTALYGKLDVSPVWLVAGRAVFCALSLTLLGLATQKPLALPPGRRGAAALSGGLLALHWLTFFVAVRWAGVAVATLTFATFPLVIIVVEAARARRRPSWIEFLAGLAIVGAVALISGGPEVGARPTEGLLVGLLSAAAFGVFAVVAQAAGRHTGAISLSLHQNLMVAAVMAPLLLFAPVPRGAGEWAGIAALGVVGTALSHQLYLFSMTRLPAAVCGALISLEPVYAIGFAALLFGDPLSPAVFVSAALIVGASMVLLRKDGGGSAVI